VLIPVQVENSSKKRKVRLQLAAARPSGTNYIRNPSPESVSEPVAVSEFGELPDTPSASLNLHSDPTTLAFPTFPAPEGSIPHKSPPELAIDHFKLLSLNDEMAENTLEQQPISPAGSLDEFDDTRQEFSRPPLSIGGMSEAAHSKQPAYPPHMHLARHGYRHLSVIPESEEVDPMDENQGLPPPLHQQSSQEPHQPLQQQPPQQPYQPCQRYQLQQQQPPQRSYQVQQPFQQYDAAASIAQATAAMNAMAAQMANLATVLVQNQNAVQAGNNGMCGVAAGPPDDNHSPTLKPSDVATFEPQLQSDADSASHFIDCIRDAVAHYGEPRIRTVLRRCCKGSIAEDWIAGVSDHNRILLRMNCSNWTSILECDFMPYLASRLSTARAETFCWNQGWTPAEYIAKKLRLLRMANVVWDDEVVEELHRGYAAAPNLHLHLDKYVTEVGNSISEYRRAVVRLQDSARHDGDSILPQPHVGTHRPPFRKSSGNWSSNTSQPHMPVARNGIGAACDTGVVFVTRVWRESKVIRLLSIIHSGIILDLVCGFGVVSVVVLVRVFVLIFSRRGEKSLSFYWRAPE